MRVADDHLVGGPGMQPAMKLTERPLAADNCLVDSMHPHVRRIEPCPRIDRHPLATRFATVLELHDPDLTDRAHVRIGCLHIQCDESHVPSLRGHPAVGEGMAQAHHCHRGQALRPLLTVPSIPLIARAMKESIVALRRNGIASSRRRIPRHIYVFASVRDNREREAEPDQVERCGVVASRRAADHMELIGGRHRGRTDERRPVRKKTLFYRRAVQLGTTGLKGRRRGIAIRERDRP